MIEKDQRENALGQNFSFVYYYFLAGIMLLVAVFLFLPRTSVG
ncbi:MAG TPA: hypothetical protein VJB37_00470 [Patescibacteria group bacterium]|nr:hypothetical protein [Patescibacteria group bacterium]